MVVARIATVLVLCFYGVEDAPKQAASEKPRMKVEIRWVEPGRIEGLTEDKAIPASCDPANVVYPRKKPALVLTRAEVAEARLGQVDFPSSSGVLKNYSVTLVLTKDARDRLAAECPGKRAKLTVAVDGRFWGIHCYSTDNNDNVSEQCKAQNFNPFIGFFSSKDDADSIVNAFK